MLVDAALLPDTPPAFQQYVKEFFVEKKVLGQKVFTAALSLSNGFGVGHGVAPSHSLDLRRFRDGLPAGQDLSEWIGKAEGRFLWRFYGVSEHSDCGACDDD